MTFVLFFWPLYTTAEDFKSNDENEDFQEQIKFIPKLETLDMRCKEIQMHAKAEKKNNISQREATRTFSAVKSAA